MKRFLLFVIILLFACFFAVNTRAQGNQTVSNGAATAPVNFPAGGCIYQWTNNNPNIGLAASGTGNIPLFTAVNTGSSPVTATITATPLQSAGYAYIANNGDATLSVISILTQMVVAIIPLGSQVGYIWVSPDGSRVYVSDNGPKNVMVINTATNKVIATIPLPNVTFGLTVSPDGKQLYVCNGPNVSIISTATNKVTGTIAIADKDLATDANELAVSPDGSTLYVSDYSDDDIVVINIATGAMSTIPDREPYYMTVSPDGKQLYAVDAYNNYISAFNTATHAFSGISLANPAESEVLSPDGSLLYATVIPNDPFAPPSIDTVYVINTATNKVINKITVGKYAVGISITPDGSQLYVCNEASGTVSVISTATNTVTATIPVGQGPGALGSFITAGQPCTGLPVTFTITVNSTTNITTGTVTGSITACQGSASASPDIEQFTVSGNNLTGDITAMAPTGFQISLAAGSGYGSSVTLNATNGVVNSTVIYVRSAPFAPVGGLAGNVVLSSTGVASQDVAVTGTVYAQTSPSVGIAASANNICAGTPVTFTATPTNGGSAPVYQWSVNNSNAGTNSPTFTRNTLANNDVVTCTITSNAPCVTPATATGNSVTMNIIAQVSPSVSIAASANGICTGTPVTFTANPTNGGSTPSYRWQVNSTDASTDNPIFISSTLANGDIVTCTITSNAACVTPASGSSNPVTMSIIPPPVVDAGGNKTIDIGQSTTLNGSASGSIADITWAPALGLSNNKILNPVASPVTTTTYMLMVQAADGCIGLDSATVIVRQTIVVPNTFTPNGDGINDTWDIKYLAAYQNCTIQVFNRWGQKVFNSIGYGIPWNGTYNGAALPIGTYYYLINLKNNTGLLSGFVEIVR